MALFLALEYCIPSSAELSRVLILKSLVRARRVGSAGCIIVVDLTIAIYTLSLYKSLLYHTCESDTSHVLETLPVFLFSLSVFFSASVALSNYVYW